MKVKIFEVFDYVLFSCVLILVVMGIAFIYSSGINSEGILVTNEYIKQIIWASLGIILMILTALYDYNKAERYAQNLYIGLLAVLLYTCLFGRYVNGARSWLGIGDFGIQPSEFGKIIFIVFLAKYLSESKNESNQLKRFMIAICIFTLPACLILVQPDLGTASVYIPIFLVMCFMAGIPGKYIVFILGIGFGTICLTILPVWNAVIAKKSFAVIGALTVPKLRLLLIMASALITVIGLTGYRYFRGKKYYYWISYVFLIIVISLVFSYGAGKVLKD